MQKNHRREYNITQVCGFYHFELGNAYSYVKGVYWYSLPTWPYIPLHFTVKMHQKSLTYWPPIQVMGTPELQVIYYDRILSVVVRCLLTFNIFDISSESCGLIFTKLGMHDPLGLLFFSHYLKILTFNTLLPT